MCKYAKDKRAREPSKAHQKRIATIGAFLTNQYPMKVSLVKDM